MTLTTTIAAAIHEACIEDWRRMDAKGFSGIYTEHCPDAHRAMAERVAAALAPLVAAVPDWPFPEYDDQCYLCGLASEEPHADDCRWLAARALLEGREP